MPAPGAPNWETVTRDVRCPLCEYNLRGLADARCPECGHRFNWPEVLDPRTGLHPYLFEHHPERNVQSFVRTIVGSLNAARFWESLSPTQPSRPGRLTLYWILTAMLAVAVLLVDWFRAGVQVHDWWNMLGGGMILSNTPPDLSLWWRRAGKYASEAWQYDQTLGATVQFVGFWLLWPWLTLATLMIFRASMRRAKVRTVHVVRCVVYSSDVVAWLAAFALVCVVMWFFTGRNDVTNFPFRMYNYFTGSIFVTVRGWTGLCLWVFAAIRLCLAYRRYMRFDHAVATVLASQLIVMLAVLKLVLDARSPWAPF